MAQEQGVADAAGYLSVLAAISQGASCSWTDRRSRRASQGALAHPLTVLTEAQLVTPLADALKQRRTTFQVAEPVLRLQQPGSPRTRHASYGIRGQGVVGGS